ncbi:MAG TPA: RDD family protein [Nitrospiraceae bacterium]|nr:RDD family protein [Nitrospiraceae bacterium]
MAEESWGANPVEAGVYPKAHILNRFLSKFVDLLIVLAVGTVVPPVGWLAGLGYVLIADGFSGGQSLGKRLIGLQTVIPRTQEASGFKESIIRNLPLAAAYLLYQVPYLGWVVAAAIAGFEALLIIGNDRGLRLGDEIAHTQVLDAGQLDLRD